MLEELKDAFVIADIDGNGKLDFDEFKAVFKMKLNISDAKVYRLPAFCSISDSLEKRQ